jgi:hypothetical protein
MKAAHGLGAAPLPLSTNNRAKLAAASGGPGILNQGDTSSCEGHAHASAITLRYALMGTPVPLVSPIGLYDFARMVGRSPNADGSLPALTDDGTEPSLIISGMQEWGIVSAKTWGDYPADPSTINVEPTVDDVADAAEFELSGAYFLKSAGDQFCTDLMTALAAGFPVTSAIAASSDTFQNYRGGVLGPLDEDVDHASAYVDYSWDGANLSSLVIYGVNSWGDVDASGAIIWGEGDAPGILGGMYRANRDFVAQYANDACVLDVQAVKAGATLR